MAQQAIPTSDPSSLTLTTTSSLLLPITILVLVLLRTLYRLSPFHPLSLIPTAPFPALTSLWLNTRAFTGRECTAVHALHSSHGPIVRTGPSRISIADGTALRAIYLERGGFRKPEFYRNFDIDGHVSLFSATDAGYRGPRARAVLPLFSSGAIRRGRDVITEAVEGFLGRLRREIARAAERGDGRVDMLGLCRGFAIDVPSAYLFGVKYGACDEDLHEKWGVRGSAVMSAAPMVDALVAVGAIWYLPPWMFKPLLSAFELLFPDVAAAESTARVDTFVAKVVAGAASDDNENDKENEDSSSSYPARLLRLGCSASEVRAQCKDVLFAATDSTAMTLATICFMLAQSPDKYDTLCREVRAAASMGTGDELQSLPYLRGVVKEGLRMALALPAGYPRVVPATGLKYRDNLIPAGTVVSCMPYELHFNGKVFDHPEVFKPERWLSSTEEMSRDLIPFGLGSRQCIARNLATEELFRAVGMMAAQDALRGLRPVKPRIDILQWFNSRVVGGKIEFEVTHI